MFALLQCGIAIGRRCVYEDIESISNNSLRQYPVRLQLLSTVYYTDDSNGVFSSLSARR